MIRLSSFLCLLILGCSQKDTPIVQPSHPIAAREITLIGNPFSQADGLSTRIAESLWSATGYATDAVEQRYAHNVWDIQLWNGKIYLGSGNSNNTGPAQNAGPVPVVAYNLATGQFNTEFTVDEEQISHFRVIDDQLYIPGHDPRDSWALGNFYRLKANGWEKVRTIPNGIHTYDMIVFDGAIYAALGTQQGAVVARSTDQGNTWTENRLPGTRRAFKLFVLADTLYTSAFKNRGFRYENNQFVQVDVNIFPGVDPRPHPLVVRPTPIDTTLLYIGADAAIDHHWHPFAAYRATQLNDIQRLMVPENSLPYDILVRDGTAYIMTNEFNLDESQVTVVIYRSKDLEIWEAFVRCVMPSMARSFEYYNGAFYIGLGTHATALNEAAGAIYRVVPP